MADRKRKQISVYEINNLTQQESYEFEFIEVNNYNGNL